MQSARLSNKELTDLIFYGILENGLNPDNIKSIDIKIVLTEYHELCNEFKNCYVNGELDTFKRAACLLVAVNNRKFCLDHRLNASIALDTAYKMCEKPYWNVGKNFNIPEKMEEVDFKKIFENNKNVYETSKNTLIDSLVYEKGVPLNYYLNLQLFYEVALSIKHREDYENVEITIDEENKPKLFVKNLFNRNK